MRNVSPLFSAKAVSQNKKPPRICVEASDHFCFGTSEMKNPCARRGSHIISYSSRRFGRCLVETSRYYDDVERAELHQHHLTHNSISRVEHVNNDNKS